MKKQYKFNILRYLPVFIILLSISIIIGSTFAYFTDKKDVTSELKFSKVELSSETSYGVNKVLQDAIPGTAIIDDTLSFSKAIESENIYVRAKISFSSEYEELVDYLDSLRSANGFNINNTIQNNNAKWSEKEGNYYYLLNSVDGGLKIVDDTYTYVLSDKIIIPRDLKQLDNLAQYMKSINIHIAFQAIQADNISNNINDIKEIFNEVFPESQQEAMYQVKVVNTGNSEVTVNYVSKNTLIEEPAPVSKTGYVLDGWYLNDGSENGNWGEQLSFPYKVVGNITLYSKFKKSDVLIVKQNEIGPNSTLEKLGDNLKFALSKEGTVYTEDDYLTSAPVYKDIEIRALKYATKEVVAVLDVGKLEEDKVEGLNYVTTENFPWGGVFDNNTPDNTTDDIQVDIYTYYPTHYISYIPYEANNSAYFILSDKELGTSYEVENGVTLTLDSMNTKKIDEYYRATFNVVYDQLGNEGNYVGAQYTDLATTALRSVAQQLIGIRGRLQQHYIPMVNTINATYSAQNNLTYVIDDYRQHDYQILYLIKYAGVGGEETAYGYNSQMVVGRGVSDVTQTTNRITNLTTHTAQDSEGYGATPTIANCNALAGRDGYVGVDGRVPVWCLGVADPWGNCLEFQNGIIITSDIADDGTITGNMFYCEDVTKYVTTVTMDEAINAGYKKYTNIYSAENDFNPTYNIYGSNEGQVDNPLIAFVMNNRYGQNNGSDYLRLCPSQNASYKNRIRWSGGYYNMGDTNGIFFSYYLGAINMDLHATIRLVIQ